MAKKKAVWGIDIGNSSLKALRCQAADEPGKIEAVAFDFIEHSKTLSQPGSEPAEILAETIKTFLARNQTKGDRVAISVSGQNTISRFLKLPPVDPKKIPDIIKYEAKQWLPFALEEVIWTFQPIGTAGQSPTAVQVDSEVGMFAMKRDIAQKTLSPYLTNAIDVDCIQSSPLAIYNFAAFDQLAIQNIEEYDPDNPPDSLVILCIGTDATDVVITNGFSIWIRSIPIGGSSFTKALTKGLKLTFSKAEYLKRNAAAAQDPKAVFQAMKPVFNDMLSEVHRSLEYYQSLNRKVKFNKILAIGNPIKMPGLRQFLTQNLGYEVIRLSHFNRLVGSEVIDAPLFKENLYSFAVSYGLALQQMGEAPLTTNLIPKEIITDRLIREKKPWVLATASALLLGLTIQFAGASNALRGISIGDYGKAEDQAKSAQTLSSKMKSETAAAVSVFKEIDTVGRNLTSNVEGRITWLELLRAINSVLPVAEEKIDGQSVDALEKQDRVFISNIEAITVDNLAEWFKPLKENKRYYPDEEEVIEALASGTSGETTTTAAESTNTNETAANATNLKKKLSQLTESQRLELIPGPPETIPEGSIARVVQLVGYHYHNASVAGTTMGSDYLRKTILRNLKFGEIILPSTLEKQMKNPQDPQFARETVSMRDLGISYPTLLDIPKIQQTEILNPRVVLEIFKQERTKILEHRRGGGGFGGGRGRERDRDSMVLDTTFNRPFDAPTGGDASGGSEYIKKIAKEMNAKDKIKLRRFDFVIQFAWVETPPSVRERKREEVRLAALAKQGEQTGSPSVLEGETTEPPVPAESPATSTESPNTPPNTPAESPATSTESSDTPAESPTTSTESPNTPAEPPATPTTSTQETPVPPT
ncbi:MAG: pilus assembly protein PilM [Planctomycetaceae bacterium]|jgi:type IV pilus assembly protein PilM|nr:pilus assembly protein PilM [Planctomycetaceae bacterium]